MVEKPHQRTYFDGTAPSSILDVINVHRSGSSAQGRSSGQGTRSDHPGGQQEEEGASEWTRDSSPSGLSTSTPAASAALSPKGSPATSGGSPVPLATGAGKSPESMSIASLDLEPTVEDQARYSTVKQFG